MRSAVVRPLNYVEQIVASGFHALRQLPTSAREAALDGYLQGILEHDFPELGYTVRRPATLRAVRRGHLDHDLV